MLTLLDLLNDVERAAHGQVDHRDDEVRLANQGGRMLVYGHEWAWRQRPPLSLDFVANQSYVELPANFAHGDIIDLDMNDTLGFKTQRSDMAEINNLRGQTFSSHNVYWWTLVWPDPVSATDPPGPARIELHPAPGSTTAGAIKASVRGGWRELHDGGDVANVPPAFESLLRRCVRAETMDYIQGTTDNVDSLLNSRQWDQMRIMDGSTMDNVGRMGGGMMDYDYGTNYQWNFETSGGVRTA